MENGIVIGNNYKELNEMPLTFNYTQIYVELGLIHSPLVDKFEPLDE